MSKNTILAEEMLKSLRKDGNKIFKNKESAVNYLNSVGYSIEKGKAKVKPL